MAQNKKRRVKEKVKKAIKPLMLVVRSYMECAILFSTALESFVFYANIHFDEDDDDDDHYHRDMIFTICPLKCKLEI